MTASLDSILSGKGDSAPAPAVETENPPAQATTETPEAPTTETSEPPETDVGGQKMVPKAALDEARGKAKRYTEQVASFETTVSEMRRQNDGLSRQVTELLQRIPVPQQQPRNDEPPPDFFADPDAALTHRLSPFENRLNTVAQTMTLRASKAENIAAHGREAVTKMEAAIGEAMASGDQEMPALRAAMLQSDDPVGVAMSWYQRRSVLNEVGSDPAAYRQKLRDELKAEILAELKPEQGNPPANNGQGAPVMPTNLAGARNVGSRTGPAWSGPTPLNDIFKR